MTSYKLIYSETNAGVVRKSEGKDIDPPEWHEDILKVRLEKIENGTAEFISFEDFKAGKKYENNYPVK